MLTLLQSFHGTFGELKFDHKLAKKLYLYRVGIVTRSRDHMEFFGGNLLGTHRIWFKDAYVTEFYEGILDIPFETVKHDLSKVTTIDHSFKVSADCMNQTLMYMIHRFMHAPGLSDQQKYNAMLDLAMIFYYRCLCIIISDQFNFTADPKVAQQAYANLSMKFLIKKLGTWNKVIDYRARALVDKKESIHWRSLWSYDDDSDIVYAINDSQGRMKGIVKEYYSELVLVAQGGDSVGIAKSLVKDAEGDDSIREKAAGAETYIAYMRSILMDRHTFIRDDMLDVVSRSNTNTSKRSVREVLEWMSDGSTDAKVFSQVDYFMSKTLVLCLHYVDTQIPANRRKDMVYVMKTLKDLFLSTRSVDPDLLEVREKGGDIVERALRERDDNAEPSGIQGKAKPSKASKLSDSLLKATRTAVIMYVCLRALTGAK